MKKYTKIQLRHLIHIKMKKLKKDKIKDVVCACFDECDTCPIRDDC